MTAQVRIAGSEAAFACEAGQTVLDAALAAGLDLPYSCRKGVCAECACPVLQGSVQAPPTDLVSGNERLLCQCTAEGEVLIAPPQWRRADPAARQRLQVKVFRNQRVADDVNVLHLRLAAGRRAKFKAGQYLQLLLPDGSRRSYSIASPPHESDTLQLHVRHVPGGAFTQIVTGLAPGAPLTLELPYGRFALRAESTGAMWCVAGGTGFAPVKALLDDMLKRGVHRPVTLFWGGRDRQGLYLLSALQRWQRAWPDFRFVPAVEDAADAAQLQAFHGRLAAAWAAHWAAGVPRPAEVYCCGAPPMVMAAKAWCLQTLDLPATDFLADLFVPGPAMA
jgi:NAD(P)H-flavin reductase/ferredoxin